jgi:hypothetical protein
MKLIRFVPRISNKEDMLVEPVSCKKLIPEWYKNGEMFYEGPEGKEHPGLKTCKPFIDVMIAGYFLLIPFDINVSVDENNNLKIGWDGPEAWSGFIGERPKGLGSTIPVPAGHRSNHLVWSSMWGWKTPRGWSSIITHPFNRSDLPFRTASGMIDSDRFMGSGNSPFHLLDNFTGVIPKGTPYAQVIPVKRSSWKSFADYGLTMKADLRGLNLRKPGQDYKNIEWVRKEYE